MDDLVQWLRKRIEAHLSDTPTTVPEARRFLIALYDAHAAILDRYQHEQQRRDGELLRLEALEDAVRALSLAYQHDPGYRDEWRP